MPKETTSRNSSRLVATGPIGVPLWLLIFGAIAVLAVAIVENEYFWTSIVSAAAP